MPRSISAARIVVAAGCAAVAIVGSSTRRVLAADDLLERTRAMYGSLKSYADTGVVAYETSPTYRELARFTTYLSRNPRRFYLDVRLDGSKWRHAVWADADAFHTWVSDTGEQYDFPNPNNAGALRAGGSTRGVGAKIPTLLYSKVQLGGDLVNFADGIVEGTEVVGGHTCYRLAGTARDVYAATGKEVNIRKLTAWIDTESLLIRKIVQQWKAVPPNISRETVTYEPQANPTLDESKFRFVPPYGGVAK